LKLSGVEKKMSTAAKSFRAPSIISNSLQMGFGMMIERDSPEWQRIWVNVMASVD